MNFKDLKIYGVLIYNKIAGLKLIKNKTLM